MTITARENELIRDYPDRPQLIGNVAGLLKASRRSLTPNSPAVAYSGPTGVLFLDAVAKRELDRLVDKLIRHQNFEYLRADDAERALYNLLAGYQTDYREGRRPPIRDIASAFIDESSRPVERAHVYLGVRHLALSRPVDVGIAQFLPAADADLIRPALGDTFGEASVYCLVEATGGTRSKLVDRAEHTAMVALSLLRLGLSRSFLDLHREQLLFDLHPVHAIQYEGEEPGLGRRRRAQPIDLDLSAVVYDWATNLENEGHTVAALARPLHERVETALEWMDIAARAPTWKTQVPAIFSAIESLLVPEDCGHKAEVVTVRSVILQIALGDGFSHPAETYAAYLVRCDLVHGSPLWEDVTEETQRLADRCAWWAREIMSVYIAYASTTAARTAEALVQELDRSEAGQTACRWFLDQGAAELVTDYRRVVGLPAFGEQDVTSDQATGVQEG